jgi:drug efflux transport system permease protein
VTRKESSEITRSTFYVVLSILSPVIMFILFSYGFTLEVKHVPLAVVDEDNSALSREYISTFANNIYFRLTAYHTRMNALYDDMQTDRIRVGIIIPHDFSQDLSRGRNVDVQILINGTMSYYANTVKGYVEALHSEFNRKLLERFIRSNGGMTDSGLLPIEINVDTWFNPSLRSEDFLVPANLAFVLFFFPTLFAALTVAREREAGTILNMYASPMRKYEYIFGKVIPYILISFMDFVIFFIMTVSLFGVRFRGDIALYFVITLVYIIGVTGIGLLISQLVRSQVAVIVIATIGTMMPGFLYSGYMVPIESMGPDAQMISVMLPITYYLRISRVMFLKGAELSTLFPDVQLALFGVLVFLYGTYRFRKYFS